MDTYRALTPGEIAALEASGSTADDWSSIEVAEDFHPSQLRGARLGGRVRLASGVCIRNSGVRNYDIGAGTLVEEVVRLECRGESAFAAAFQADDLFDERPCADVVVADAGVADAHARCEPDTAAQPCAAQLRGVKVLRHLDRRPVVGRRAGGFERGDFAGGQSSVCVHSRHISNLQI